MVPDLLWELRISPLISADAACQEKRQVFLTEKNKMTHWKIVYLKCLQMSQFQSTEETASCKEKFSLPTCIVKILSNCLTSLEIYLWSVCACWRSLCLWDGLNFALQFSHTSFLYCCWVSSPARRKYRNSGVCFLYSGMASVLQCVANKDNYCSKSELLFDHIITMSSH